MSLPTNIDLPCMIIGSSVQEPNISVNFRVVDEPTYKGQSFIATTTIGAVDRQFGGDWPQIADHFIIKKRGDTFTFGAPYSPLNT